MSSRTIILGGSPLWSCRVDIPKISTSPRTTWLTRALGLEADGPCEVCQGIGRIESQLSKKRSGRSSSQENITNHGASGHQQGLWTGRVSEATDRIRDLAKSFLYKQATVRKASTQALVLTLVRQPYFVTCSWACGLPLEAGRERSPAAALA
jgi:hypothetical protein